MLWSAILGSGILDITDNLAVFTVLFTTENFYLFHFCSPSHHSLVTFEPAVIRHRRHPQAVITSPDKILLQLSRGAGGGYRGSGQTASVGAKPGPRDPGQDDVRDLCWLHCGSMAGVAML